MPAITKQFLVQHFTSNIYSSQNCYKINYKENNISVVFIFWRYGIFCFIRPIWEWLCVLTITHFGEGNVSRWPRALKVSKNDFGLEKKLTYKRRTYKGLQWITKVKKLWTSKLKVSVQNRVSVEILVQGASPWRHLLLVSSVQNTHGNKTLT